jgi:hypothetical protein
MFTDLDVMLNDSHGLMPHFLHGSRTQQTEMEAWIFLLIVAAVAILYLILQPGVSQARLPGVLSACVVMAAAA